MEIKLNYSIEIAKSNKGNQVVKLIMTNERNQTKTYFGEIAVNKIQELEYIFGKDNLKYIKELKNMTDKYYLINNVGKK